MITSHFTLNLPKKKKNRKRILLRDVLCVLHLQHLYYSDVLCVLHLQHLYYSFTIALRLLRGELCVLQRKMHPAWPPGSLDEEIGHLHIHGGLGSPGYAAVKLQYNCSTPL